LFSASILKLPENVRELIKEDRMEVIDAMGEVNLSTFQDLLSVKQAER
jgi:hypothetical protein